MGKQNLCAKEGSKHKTEDTLPKIMPDNIKL
jgi:hypothetical protein